MGENQVPLLSLAEIEVHCHLVTFFAQKEDEIERVILERDRPLNNFDHIVGVLNAFPVHLMRRARFCHIKTVDFYFVFFLHFHFG